MGFGELLKDKLAEKHMTVAELSKVSGIPASTLYAVIRRDSTMKLETIANIAHCLEMDMAELIPPEEKILQESIPKLDKSTKTGLVIKSRLDGSHIDFLTNELTEVVEKAFSSLCESNDLSESSTDSSDYAFINFLRIYMEYAVIVLEKNGKKITVKNRPVVEKGDYVALIDTIDGQISAVLDYDSFNSFKEDISDYVDFKIERLHAKLTQELADLVESALEDTHSSPDPVPDPPSTEEA